MSPPVRFVDRAEANPLLAAAKSHPAMPDESAPRSPSSTVPTPFEVSVPEAALRDLRGRLEQTRWPDDFANEAWSFGVEREYLTELTDYWRDGFDWRVRKKRR